MRISHNEKAYRLLRERLLTGELVPGHKLNDNDLAKDLGMSRTPVREAVIRLSNEGFCHQIPGMGTYVRVPDEKEISDLFELRLVLESHAVMKAALDATEYDIADLEMLCQELRDCAVETRKYISDENRPAELVKRSVSADVKFHLLIVQIADNQRLMKIIDDLAIMSHLCANAGQGWKLEGKSLLKDAADTFKGHYRVLRAIKKKDPIAARECLIEHLVPSNPLGGKNRLLGMHRIASKRPSHVQDELRKVVRNLESINSHNLLNL